MNDDELQDWEALLDYAVAQAGHTGHSSTDVLAALSNDIDRPMLKSYVAFLVLSFPEVDHYDLQISFIHAYHRFNVNTTRFDATSKWANTPS